VTKKRKPTSSLKPAAIPPRTDPRREALLRASPSNPTWQGYATGYGGLYRGMSRNGFGRDDYGLIMAYLYVDKLRSAIDVIAENAMQARFVVIDADGNETASDDKGGDSPFLDILSEQLATQKQQLFDLWVRDLLLLGRSYIEITKNGGIITHLRRVNPLAITPQIQNGRIIAYNYAGMDTGRSFPQFTLDQLLYTYLPHPGDDLDGYSPATSALAKANVIIKSEQYHLAWLNNQGQPGMIATPKSDSQGIGAGFDLEDAQEIADLWRKEFQGAENFFRTYVSHIPFDITQLQLADIRQPLEVTTANEDALLETFRVPRRMLGGGSNGGVYESAEEVKKAFIQTVVAPYLFRLQAWVNTFLMPYIEPGKRFLFDISHFETTSEENLRKHQILREKLSNGGLTLNAYRSAIGQAPLKGGEILFLPSGITIDVKMLAEMDGRLLIGMPGQITESNQQQHPVDEPTALEPEQGDIPDDPNDDDPVVGISENQARALQILMTGR